MDEPDRGRSLVDFLPAVSRGFMKILYALAQQVFIIFFEPTVSQCIHFLS